MGIILSGDYNMLMNNTANSNVEDDGIALHESHNNTLTANTANGNANAGIHLYEDSSNNILTTNTVSNNTEADFYSTNNSENNTITDLTVSSYPTTLSFTFDNGIAIKGVETAPAADPAGKLNISKYVNITNVSESSWIELQVGYEDADLGNVSESSLRLWRYNGTWSEVPNSSVNVTANFVSANIGSFSVFAPMGDAPSAPSTCENETQSFETTYGVSINVSYAGTNQTINITDGNKTVEIHMLCHSLTCDELVDLLKGLDLATFETLPEVIELDYCSSVHYKTWLNSSDYDTSQDPDLAVFNLDLLVGNGSLARPDVNISCGSSGGDFECTDERVIVGVSELTKLAQSYEGQQLGFNVINISQDDTGNMTVKYLNHDVVNLTVDFDALVQPPSGMLLENVTAADLVAGFGSPLDWGDAPPKYTFIQCSEEWNGNWTKNDLVVEYYLNASDPAPSLKLVFDPPTPPNIAAVTAGGGSYFGWGSPTEYELIRCYTEINVSSPKGYDIIVKYYLNATDLYPNETVRLDPPTPLEITAIVAATGSKEVWTPTPTYQFVMGYTTPTAEGEKLIVDCGITEGTVDLTVKPEGLAPLPLAVVIEVLISEERANFDEAHITTDEFTGEATLNLSQDGVLLVSEPLGDPA